MRGLRLSDDLLEGRLRESLGVGRSAVVGGGGGAVGGGRGGGGGGGGGAADGRQALHPLQALAYLKRLSVHPALVTASEHGAYRQRLLQVLPWPQLYLCPFTYYIAYL